MAVEEKRFRFYKGRPVKRMREVRNGILLTFLSSVKGQAGEQITVSQRDWERFGEWRSVSATHMNAMRELVRH